MWCLTPKLSRLTNGVARNYVYGRKTRALFGTVGLVIWPVKIVPEITYYVSSGTLNPTHSLTPAGYPTEVDLKP